MRLLLVVFISFGVINTVEASQGKEPSHPSCEHDGFINRYYLLDIESVNSVLSFYKQLPAYILNNNNTTFVLDLGQRTIKNLYFDFNDYSLLKNNQELYLSNHINLPNYRIEREKIVFADHASTTRQQHVFEAKRYNKKVTALDKHQLFSRVKRSERQTLSDLIRLKNDTSVEQMVETIEINHDQQVMLFQHFGESIGEVVFDIFSISNFGIPNTHYLFKLEIFQKKIKDLKQQERLQLNRFYCQIDDPIQKNLPNLTPISNFGYQSYFQLAEQQLPNRKFLNNYPVVFKLGQVLVLTFIGFLVIYLLLGRYSKKDTYRKVNKAKDINSEI